VTVDGIRYLVDRSDDGPGGALFVWRVLPEFAALRRAVDLLAANGESPAGRLLVDVGANIGTTCLPAVARLGFAGAVAIEPDRRNARVLRANADLNGLSELVAVVEAAAGDEEGEATFVAGKTTKGGRHRSGAGALHSDREGDAVRVVTVDAELERRSVAPGEVGLLWADVQGHEAKVARGAQSLLEASRPFVFAARIGKLERVGDSEKLVSLIGKHYRYVVELRDTGPTDLRPAAQLEELLRASPMTDVLALGSA
jgi:FkbM family methyltransferase